MSTALERAKLIRFHDGTQISYAPPKNTMDLRYVGCSDHHPACDCREALFAEDMSEYRSEREQAARVFNDVLDGHPTFAYGADGEPDTLRECKCTGCEIARRTYFRGLVEVYRERHEARSR